VELETGDIIISHEIGSGTSQLIALFSGSYWSHTSLYLKNGYVIEAVKYGVRIIPFNEAFHNTNFIVLRCPFLTQYQKEKIESVAMQYLDQTYDYAGCVTVLRKMFKQYSKDVGSKNSVMCSCLVSDVYRKVGMNLFPFNNYPLPGDFEKNKLLERIY